MKALLNSTANDDATSRWMPSGMLRKKPRKCTAARAIKRSSVIAVVRKIDSMRGLKFAWR